MNEKIKSNIPSEEIPTSLNVMKIISLHDQMDLMQNFEFFKFFQSDLCKFIEKSFQYSLKNGMLSNVQSQGISILPKENTPR